MESEHSPVKSRMTVEQKSEREMVLTRTFDGPARMVFAAWTTPDLLKRWWAPKSSGLTLASCEVDARTGGSYRFVFDLGNSKTMTFFGKYLEVIPNARLVWTNEECEEGSVTTLTLEEKDGKTLVVMQERYPSKEACDAALEGMGDGMPECFDQLDELLVTLG